MGKANVGCVRNACGTGVVVVFVTTQVMSGVFKGKSPSNNNERLDLMKNESEGWTDSSVRYMYIIMSTYHIFNSFNLEFYRDENDYF